LDREDYSASIHSLDDGSESGTDASSVVPDEPLVAAVKRTKRSGLVSTLAHEHAEKLDENYCGLCGTIHVETCHMVQNPDNLAEYRALLMDVKNEEPIDLRVSGSAPNLFISVLTNYTARSSPSHRREALENWKTRPDKGPTRVPCRYVKEAQATARVRSGREYGRACGEG